MRTSTSSATASRHRFFAGLWGIFGHGNIGGVAQAVQQYGPGFPYYLGRNEQAMVHAAVGYAKLANRLAGVRVPLVDRPRCDEHGHWRGIRDHQPRAGAAARR